MRVRVACIAVLLACAAAASPALGALSLSGPTGLVALPSAEVVPAEMVGAAADITDSDFTGTTLPGANVTVTVECREDKSAYTTDALADGRFCVPVELFPFIRRNILINVFLRFLYEVIDLVNRCFPSNAFHTYHQVFNEKFRSGI